MKRVKLRVDVSTIGTEKLSSAIVFRAVLSASPGRGMAVDEIRHRVRVLDALDAAGDGEWLNLEDEDAKVLSAAVEAYPWATASHGLLLIIEDALHPEPVPTVKVVPNDRAQ